MLTLYGTNVVQSVVSEVGSNILEKHTCATLTIWDGSSWLIDWGY